MYCLEQQAEGLQCTNRKKLPKINSTQEKARRQTTTISCWHMRRMCIYCLCRLNLLKCLYKRLNFTFLHYESLNIGESIYIYIKRDKVDDYHKLLLYVFSKGSWEEDGEGQNV